MAVNAQSVDEKSAKLAELLRAKRINNIIQKINKGNSLTRDEERIYSEWEAEKLKPPEEDVFRSQTECAKHYGVKPPTIASHVSSGNIKREPDGTYLKSNTDAYFVDKLGREKKPIGWQKKKELQKDGRISKDSKTLIDINKQKLRKLEAEAELKELQTKQLRDELIPLDDVIAGWNIRSKAVRDALLNMIERLPPILANQEQGEIEKILKDDVYGILEAFAKNGRYTPAED